MRSPWPVFFNLAVKSKAIYQPNFRFRRWSENEKKTTPDGEDESVQDIEIRLPPLKGQKASVVHYVKKPEHMEFQLVADQLLKIVGGENGLRYDPSKPALIGGPGCELFVGQVDIRRLYCSKCQVYHHRDVMAAENITNIIQEYLVRQERPDCLHPGAEDGSLPWKAKRDARSSSSSSTATASNAISCTGVQGRRKRASTTSTPEQEQPQKSSKSSKLAKALKASKS
ncbi:hypothetical protein KI688_011656 [Linnemannia hyalina]|uniref:Uncharacterized protein n=1 Tax=Linnemannia hyalina TaxID=64524 RepID=A0A9P8BTB4_9FUNG|nr:hypothetical protein KI688_011656 [Linnemannia hyalina]